jgi:catechol 2,3-dioxygenase-like lactoylglutathione lyase family enzyme
MEPQLSVTELKAYIPARDFELSKRFYVDLGFTLEWTGPDNSLAGFGIGSARFLLQEVGETFRPDYFMMHLLVPDVQVWWDHILERRIAEKYSVKVEPPEDRSWGIRDLVVIDPSGVLWRVGQPISKHPG